MVCRIVFDIDGVLRDVGGSYRRAIADTVEHFTGRRYRPSLEDIDQLKAEGVWNNDWEASRELVFRYFESQGQERPQVPLDFETLVQFFQQRYRGGNPGDPRSWTGYIAHEPLLVEAAYFQRLQAAGIPWGFFSGATRGSATYVLQRRLGLAEPLLVAMEDAPGKPDPTGLFAVADQLGGSQPVVYVGDTVADMATVVAARHRCQGKWLGVGVLPPHVLQRGESYAHDYGAALEAAGASTVVPQTRLITPEFLEQLLAAVERPQ